VVDRGEVVMDDDEAVWASSAASVEASTPTTTSAIESARRIRFI
jgi:hypothetical protein